MYKATQTRIQTYLNDVAGVRIVCAFIDDIGWLLIFNTCFTVLYFLLPSAIYAYIGILGGIGVGFSAQYGWQAVFNTFGALAIAAETYGLQGAVSLRVIQNVFGVVFALAFCVIFYWFMSKKKKSDVTVHAEQSESGRKFE